MDTLTHGVIGALVARSCTKVDVKKSYLLVTALAAAFPDIDYLLFWLNPYKFITEWHRGITHSLIMFPLWATLISLVLYKILHKSIPFRILFACCCAGLLTHIAADLLTLYGVQLFTPLNYHRYALFTVFDMDPWIGLLAALGMILGFYKRRFARFGLLAILTYLLLVLNWQQNAKNLLADRIVKSPELTEKSYAIPQPFLPFHWKLVIDHDDHYEIAHLSLFAKASHFISKQLQFLQSYAVLPMSALQENPKKNIQASTDGTKYNFQLTDMADFRSANNLEWKKLPKFGDTSMTISLATQVWQHEAFAKFRRFASTPILYRIDQQPDSTCIWFTDLRYVFPLMMPPFRYGMCKHRQHGQWQLFRLRRHTENSRQLIDFTAP